MPEKIGKEKAESILSDVNPEKCFWTTNGAIIKSLQELVRAILTEEGFEVIAADSGDDCLEQLKTVKPDLILMDMMMPGMSGRETTEKIRKNPKTKNLKIAFLTVAQFSEVGKSTLKDLNVLNYITKPFDNDDLVKRVKKLVR